MVLPGRFELPASPLPRECSTPELRQRGFTVKAAAHCHRIMGFASGMVQNLWLFIFYRTAIGAG